MRVLRLTPFFQHPDVERWPAEFDSVGGMQVQILRQSRWLARHGVSQHVMTIGFPGLPEIRTLERNLVVERACLPLPGIRSELTGMWGLTQAWGAATLGKIVTRRSELAPDLVHVHADGQMETLALTIAARRMFSCPIVLSMHCSRIASYQPMSRLDSIKHRFACELERRALQAAHATVFLTERTQTVLAEHCTRSVVVPDVLCVESFAKRRSESELKAFRTRYGIGPGPVIAFVGRIAHEKGWRHLIGLAKRLEDLDPQILVVGDGPQRQRLQREVNAAGLERRFRTTGFVANEDVPVALQVSDCMVMVSRHEEFGGASIEAIAAGTPVFAFGVGGLESVLASLTPGRTVPHGDVDALAKLVRFGLANPIEARHSVRAGRRRLEALYSSDAVMPDMLDLYCELGRPTQGVHDVFDGRDRDQLAV